MPNPWTETEDSELEALVTTHWSWPEREEQFNQVLYKGKRVRTARALRDRSMRLGLESGFQAGSKRVIVAKGVPQDVHRMTSNGLDVVVYSRNIRTLEDLETYIELDRTKWVAASFEANKWEMGHVDEAGKGVTTPLFQIKAKFKPVSDDVQQLTTLRESVLADIRTEASKTPERVALRSFDHSSDVLVEISAPDVHLNKLAWSPETGSNYNADIAESIFRDAFDDLLGKAAHFRPSKVLVPIGNDFFQIDNRLNQTTAGTPQDADTRYVQMFRRGRSMYAWALKRCAEVIGPTTGIVVPGNHDEITTMFLGEVLEAQFHNARDIRIDCGLYPRKYVRHGNVLLGFVHGNEEKHADLPLLMANEQPEHWAQTKHREWHVGHLHKAKETRYTAGDSFGGVRVRILPSLSASDAWHARKGYTGELRAAEAYLWSAAAGYVGHLSFSTTEQKAVTCVTP